MGDAHYIRVEANHVDTPWINVIKTPNIYVEYIPRISPCLCSNKMHRFYRMNYGTTVLNPDNLFLENAKSIILCNECFTLRSISIHSLEDMKHRILILRCDKFD